MTYGAKSPIFVAHLPGGLLSQALPTDPAHAAVILGRLVSQLPPVDEAYVVPDSTLTEAQ